LILQYMIDKLLLLRVYRTPKIHLEKSLIDQQFYIFILFPIIVFFGEFMEFKYVH